MNEYNLKLKIKIPVIFCDSQSVIYFLKNNVENKRTINIDSQFFFVKDYLMKELFVLYHATGKQNASGMLTKV